jgi:hypothetical protein
MVDPKVECSGTEKTTALRTIPENPKPEAKFTGSSSLASRSVGDVVSFGLRKLNPGIFHYCSSGPLIIKMTVGSNILPSPLPPLSPSWFRLREETTQSSDVTPFNYVCGLLPCGFVAD